MFRDCRKIQYNLLLCRPAAIIILLYVNREAIVVRASSHAVGVSGEWRGMELTTFCGLECKRFWCWWFAMEFSI